MTLVKAERGSPQSLRLGMEAARGRGIKFLRHRLGISCLHNHTHPPQPALWKSTLFTTFQKGPRGVNHPITIKCFKELRHQRLPVLHDTKLSKKHVSTERDEALR